ncbi:hypothetical protein Focb16_v009914 [Fusarium oxysporum f. sp. cubense]|uniref:Uncharacterized protein n=1 Tax=Fusarium oxysporum f. sp. cubense TaxID=61366 RepID=A0A559KZE2_FUSOC|nr:hypothetical protein Focb16_v009914 [Fusarium oxysporum f. sp. cubense]
MPAVRRSLQPPERNKAYLTKCHDVIRKTEQVIKKDDHGELRDMAIEIGRDWGKENDAGRLINRGFLNLEIEELSKLEGKLLRGTNPSRREREFVKALRLGGLHDEWLEAIREQAKRVLELTE